MKAAARIFVAVFIVSSRAGGPAKNEHTHNIPLTAKITADGKDAKLVDLKAGDLIKVTVEKKGDKNEVTKIEVDRKGR